MPEQTERNWAAGCHIAAFAGLLGIPFGSIVGPLVVWLMKRAESSFIDDHGKQALNFQITLTLALAAVGYLLLGRLAIGRGLGGAGFAALVLLAIAVFGFVQVVRGAMAASRGEPFDYVVAIRFLR